MLLTQHNEIQCSTELMNTSLSISVSFEMLEVGYDLV